VAIQRGRPGAGTDDERHAPVKAREIREDDAQAMNDAPNDAPVILTIRSDARYLCLARALVGAFARQAGFDERCAGQVALAIDEALCNVMRHGYEGKSDQPIWMRLATIEEQDRTVGMRIVIEDEARQVEPAKIRSRDLADIRPGGLGVHIIREIMDDVLYEPRADRGMRLTLTRRLPSEGGRDLPVRNLESS